MSRSSVTSLSPDCNRRTSADHELSTCCAWRLALIAYPYIKRIDADPQPEGDFPHRSPMFNHLLPYL